jgi:hypothetical protein
VAASGLDLAVENFRIGRTLDVQDAGQSTLEPRQRVIDQDIVAGHVELELRVRSLAARLSGRRRGIELFATEPLFLSARSLNS